MLEVINNLKCDITDGDNNFCIISNEQLEAMKQLAKLENDEHNNVIAENKKLKSNIDNAMTFIEDNIMDLESEGLTYYNMVQGDEVYNILEGDK